MGISLMGTSLRRQKKIIRRVADSDDPVLRQQIDDLFSSRLILTKRRRTQVRTQLAAIVADSARRIVADRPGDHRALTAAVSRLSLDGASWRSYRFGDRAWQADAWRLYDITGQLRFTSNWVGSSCSRCEMYVAQVQADGSPGARVEDERISALACGPLGVGDTRSEALRLLGIDLFVGGEAYIVAESGAGSDGGDLWWVVTARQIKRQGDVITVARSPLHGGGTMLYRDGIDLILRVWTPHPADTAEADSPTRSAIPDLREMEALRKRGFAELDSRLSGAGLLALPEGMDLPRGDDDPAGASGFSALLGRVMGRSLRDRSSADAMVPIIMTGTADDIAQIRHITFWSDLSGQLGTMRESALRSLAQSLDIPPEVLLGLGSTTNHWNAWAISREAVQLHIKPVLARIAAAMTIGYLTPALESMGLDPTQYTYAFNTAPLTANPDRSTDALNLHDRLLISDAAALSASDWDTKEAPDGTERARRIIEKLLLTSPDAVLSDPALRAMINLPPADTTTTTTTTGNDVTGQPDNPGVVRPMESPPEEPQPEPVPQPAPNLSFAAHLAVRRALTLAGTRLIPHGRRPSNTPRHQLHVHHGPVPDADVRALLDGPWVEEFGGDVATTLGVDPAAFVAVVGDHCRDLLSRGIAYDPALVDYLLASPATMARLTGQVMTCV